MAASLDKNTTITTKTVLVTTDPEVEIVAEVIKTPSKLQVEKQAPTEVGSTLSSSIDPNLTTTTPSTTTRTSSVSSPQAMTSNTGSPTTRTGPPTEKPLPQRTPGERTRPGSTEARPFSARGVPPGCYSSVQTVSRSSIENGMRETARERSELLDTEEEDESYVNRLLQTVAFCTKVSLLPLKTEMKEAIIAGKPKTPKKLAKKKESTGAASPHLRTNPASPGSSKKSKNDDRRKIPEALPVPTVKNPHIITGAVQMHGVRTPPTPVDTEEKGNEDDDLKDASEDRTSEQSKQHGTEKLRTQARRDDKEDKEEVLEDSSEDSDQGQTKLKPKANSEEEQDSPKSPNLS